MSTRGPEWWLARVDAAEEAELAAARAEGRLAVVDVSEALRGCPPAALARVMEARRERTPQAQERRRREASRLLASAERAERLADMLDGKDRAGGARGQRARAAALRAEAGSLLRDLTSQV